MGSDLVRVMQARGENTATHVGSLALVDPSWGSAVHLVADGLLAISGRGMYVNRAMSVGVSATLANAELDRIVTLCDDAGVEAEIEVTPLTSTQTREAMRTRGFVRRPDLDVTLLTRPVGGVPISAPDDIRGRPVESESDLALWQQTCIAGWGHTTPEARRASDAFAAAAWALDHEYMLIAVDAADDRPLGCASTTLRDGVATLGGMATVPTERRRGVQAAMLRCRVEQALAHGCDIAATTAVTGGASERNLRRHGFEPRFVIETHTLAPI